MELNYQGKKSRDEIFELAKRCKGRINNIKGSFLIYGENFNGLSVLLSQGYKGKIDLIYIDPPFNTSQSYFIDEERQSTVSMSKSAKVAYSDKFSFQKYLEFIRERIVLMYELLSERGSLYFHIDTKMGHYCKLLLDEVFGIENFKNDITRIKSNPKNFSRKAYGNEKDVILFYAKNASKNIWNDITIPLTEEELRNLYKKEDANGAYTTIPLHAPGETKDGPTGQMWRGMYPPKGRHWRTNPAEFDKLDAQGMIEWSAKGNPRIKKYAKDHKGKKMQDIWEFKDPAYPDYPTQKNLDMLERIILQSSTPDSIVMDCFAGGGTTLLVAEKLQRKWIGMDNSNEAITVIRRRMSDVAFETLNFEEG